MNGPLYVLQNRPSVFQYLNLKLRSIDFSTLSKHAINEQWKIASKNPRTVLMCNLCIEDWHYFDMSTTYRSWLKGILNDQLSSNMNSDKMANKIYFWKTNLIKENLRFQWMINAWVQCAYLFIIYPILNNEGVYSNICFIQISC